MRIIGTGVHFGAAQTRQIGKEMFDKFLIRTLCPDQADILFRCNPGGESAMQNGRARHGRETMRSLKFILAGMIALIGIGSAAQRAVPLQPEPVQKTLQTGQSIPPRAPGTGQLTAEDVNVWLDGFMPYALSSGDIAGAVVVVVRDGQVLTQRGFGYADVARRAPVDPDRTLFRPGSVSKLFTWTAVMQLVEQGRLDLDADVNRYLDFQIPPRDGQPITLRNILTHTAGFEEALKNIIGYDAAVPPYGELLRRWTPERVFAPGTTPAYSNYATSLAGYIVERVSGEPFNTYVERHIFAPLQMRNASFAQPLPPRLRSMMATGYERASGDVVPFEIVGPSPAGSLSATGADMGRFMIAHLNQGGRILRPETARMMHTTTLPILPSINRMALGFYQTNINGQRVVAHGGDTVAFHSDLHLFIDRNVGIFISMNSLGREGAAGDLRTGLFEQFADRYFPAPRDTRRVPAATAAEHARLLTGNWQNSRGSFSNFMSLIGLLSQVSIGVDDQGRPVVPLATGANGQPRQWVEVEPFVWQDTMGHERMAARFVNGRIDRWSLDGLPFMMFDRVPWYKSSGLLTPLLLVSLLIFFLTIVLWPVRALVRRSYGTKLDLTGPAKRAHLLTRIAALAILATAVGWGVAVMMMIGDIANLSSSFDPIIWTLQILTIVAFIGGFLALAWSLWASWKAGRRWPAKVWSVLLLLASGVMLWIGFAFNLIGLGVNY